MKRLMFSFLIVAACSRSEPAKEPSRVTDAGTGTVTVTVTDAATVTATDAATVTATDAATAFDQLTKDEQMKFMRTKVMPPMKAAFKEFDAKEFGKFNCKTCHGKGAVTKEFDMPNPDLPALDFAALKAGKHAAAAKFMKETVTPQMAEILGEPMRDATHPDGFGCLDCHTEKK